MRRRTKQFYKMSINIDNNNVSKLTYLEYHECFFLSYYNNYLGFYSVLDENYCKRGRKNYYYFDFQIDSQFLSPAPIDRE